jgi:transposase
MLYRWKENAERKNGGIILSEDERTELKSLRKEVKTLRVEKEILKMPTSFSQKK